MGESSEIALTYAKIFLRELCPQNDFLDTARRLKVWKTLETEAFIHMNMPEGATPKDRHAIPDQFTRGDHAHHVLQGRFDAGRAIGGGDNDLSSDP